MLVFNKQIKLYLLWLKILVRICAFVFPEYGGFCDDDAIARRKCHPGSTGNPRRFAIWGKQVNYLRLWQLEMSTITRIYTF